MKPLVIHRRGVNSIEHDVRCPDRVFRWKPNYCTRPVSYDEEGSMIIEWPDGMNYCGLVSEGIAREIHAVYEPLN